MKKSLFPFLVFVATASVQLFAQNPDIPNAEAGKCYAKCLIPAKYETYTEQIVTRPASKRVEVVPAKTKTVTERVLVKEASKRIITIPTVYETVTEKVMVEPESKKLQAIAAEYTTETESYVMKEGYNRIESVPVKYTTKSEQVMITPASTKWIKKLGNKNCLSANPEDCQVWCLVDVPAVYKSVESKVKGTCPNGYTADGDDCTRSIPVAPVMGSRKVTKLKTPASTREIAIPAVYKTITKKVIKTAASSKEEEIAAVYKEQTRTVVETPATTREIDVPEVKTTVTKTKLVTAGGFTEWKEVVCEGQMTSELIRSLQLALQREGFPPGPIDNIFGVQTKAALKKYQEAKKLPIGNLDVQTMKSLGLKY